MNTAILRKTPISYDAMSWSRDTTLARDIMSFEPRGAFDQPTPTSFSHLAFLSTSASSWRSDSGDRLPQLEENYCQGYVCCGLNLNDLHGLLEHFEENHVLGSSPATSTLHPSNNRTAAANARATQIAQMKQRSLATTIAAQTSVPAVAPTDTLPIASASSAAFSMDDMDMDLDDDKQAVEAPFDSSVLLPSTNSSTRRTQRMQTRGLHRGTDGLALGSHSTGISSPMSSSVFLNRRSTSPTQSVSSPEASAPNTPGPESDAEFDPSASSASIVGQRGQQMFAPMGCVTPSMLLPPHFNNTPSPEAESLDDFERASPVQKRHRQQLSLDAVDSSSADGPTIMMGNDPNMTSLERLDLGEGQKGYIAPPPTLPSGRTWVAPADKPYKCTVPGCDKAYKQQNGLKYHRLHGQCNNRLREGSIATEEGDGRETLEDKPYCCYVGISCGKRYKNMNGLRYHYQHSGPHGQLGLQLIATSQHPLPLNHDKLSRHSRAGSAASSRNPSRASSPTPAALPTFQPQTFQPTQLLAH